MYGKIKYKLKSTIFPVFIVTVLITSPLTVVGDFSEDFSSNLDKWTLFSWEYPDGKLGTDVDYTWQHLNEELVSGGNEMNHTKFNFACQKTGINNGVFTFDAYGPENLFRFIFRIASFPKPVNDTSTVPIHNSSNLQIVIEHGLDINAEETNAPPHLWMDQFYNEGEERWQNRLTQLMPNGLELKEDDILGWHTYELTKNETHFLAKIDGVSIANETFATQFSVEYDSICLMAEHGTGVKFDNIAITPIIQELDEPTDTRRALFPQTVIILTLFSVSTIGIFSGRFYIKKKELEDY